MNTRSRGLADPQAVPALLARATRRLRDLAASMRRSVIGEDRTQRKGFGTAIPAALLPRVQLGVARTQYRGVPFLKSPFDIGIYLQLLSRQRPAAIIEIGTKYGGSALWFADMMTAMCGKEPTVISIDREPLAEFSDERITFLQGDAARLGEVLTEECLANLPRPLTVIEDSSHLFEDSLAVLEFFHPYLATGDYIVIEDGIVSHSRDTFYRKYKDGPNRAVMAFLERHHADYEVATELCDHYGYNVTYNPNGYLRRL